MENVFWVYWHPCTVPCDSDSEDEGADDPMQLGLLVQPTRRVRLGALPVTTPDDIQLKEGAFLRVLEQLPDGWCQGRSETTGKSGWFPTSDVEML